MVTKKIGLMSEATLAVVQTDPHKFIWLKQGILQTTLPENEEDLLLILLVFMVSALISKSSSISV